MKRRQRNNVAGQRCIAYERRKKRTGWKAEVEKDWEREEEETVEKKRGVNPFSSDASGEFSRVDESGSFGECWGDFHDDSCGFSECVPAVSSGVLVVIDVPDSPSSMVALGEALLSGSDL